jgi:hypothetical protein
MNQTWWVQRNFWVTGYPEIRGANFGESPRSTRNSKTQHKNWCKLRHQLPQESCKSPQKSAFLESQAVEVGKHRVAINLLSAQLARVEIVCET